MINVEEGRGQHSRAGEEVWAGSASVWWDTFRFDASTLVGGEEQSVAGARPLHFVCYRSCYNTQGAEMERDKT